MDLDRRCSGLMLRFPKFDMHTIPSRQPFRTHAGSQVVGGKQDRSRDTNYVALVAASDGTWRVTATEAARGETGG
ncbi:MAG: hypothetical protein ABSH09_02855 [Bryobacteraceae bacterium]